MQYDPFLLEVTVVTDGKRTNIWRKRIPLENFRNASSKCNFVVICWDFLSQERHGNLITHKIYDISIPSQFSMMLWAVSAFPSHLAPKEWSLKILVDNLLNAWSNFCIFSIDTWSIMSKTTPKSTPRKIDILNRKMEICFRWCSFSIGWFLGSKS